VPKSRGRKPGRHRSGPSGHPRRRLEHRGRDREPDLADEVAEVLAADHPLVMLSYTSALLNAMDRRNDDPADRSAQPEAPSVELFLDTVAGSGEREPTALAWAMAHLVDDEVLRARTLRTIGASSLLLPGWLQQLGRLEVVAAAEVLDPLRDVANVFVHSRLAGHDLTAVTLVDFNLGTIVKSNFFADQPLSAIAELWRREGDGTEPEPLALADARARLSHAIEVDARTWPKVETEDWPQSRPLLEWVLRQLPPGGTGFERPEWSARRRDRLVRRFLASAYAPKPARPDDRSIAGDLVWYRTDYGYGDPLRWSGAAVEILLLDWYPRKIVADDAYLRRMPQVLRALIRFGHAEAGLADATTEDAQQALAAYEESYLDAIGRPRRQGPAALLERMGVLDPMDDDGDDLIGIEDLEAFQRSMLAELVGGAGPLDRLTGEPLPDEPFAVDGIPEAVRDRVLATAELADRCCDELLDTEHRTAVRRLLHDVAVADPRSFDGRSKARTAAAAFCWMVGRANETVGYGGLQTQELMAWFGLKKPPAGRADSIRRALRMGPNSWPGALGSPRYLVGQRRTDLIGQRDRDWDLSR